MLRTKILIICSYAILSIAFVAGIAWIYREWADYNKKVEPYSEQVELVALSNALSNMYRAEGTIGLLSLANDKHWKQEYDSLITSIFTQIDSMHKVSNKLYWKHHLDTLEILLKHKQKNTDELVELSQRFSTITKQKISRETIVNKRDIKALEAILNNCNPVETANDTTVVIKKKGGLFRRIGQALKNSGPDTIQNITSNSTLYQQEVVIPMLRDTIVEFIHEMNYAVQKRNAEVTADMIAKQNELYRVNGKTTSQINLLISQLQSDDFHHHVEASGAREVAMQHFSRIVAIFAFIAIILVFIFMAWVLHSLAQNQRLHNEIKASKKHTENLLVSRERLMLMISHDIKAPISSILGYLELMKKDIFSDEYAGFIRNMCHSAVHILDLVRNLLEFHSLENKQQKKDILHFSPYLLLTEIYQSFLPEAFKKGLQYDFQSDINQKETYINDPYRIRQIINNLIANAIKFTPQNGQIVLSAKLVSDKSKQSTQLIVSVKDNGPGIREEDQQRIFDEFQRLNYDNQIEGCGLGLHIANRLAKILGGSLSVESQSGKGSTFILILPMDTIGNMPKESTVTKNTPVKKPIRVLFIDDDPIQLDMVSRLMEREGVSNRTCLSATEALTLLTKEHFDIIFSDVNMPDVNGLELVKRIRIAEFKDSMIIPIIGLSGTSLSEAECKEAGFAAFVEKPFTADQLLNTIYEYTGNKNMGFDTFIQFAGEDIAAGKSIISTFVAETEKNYKALLLAFDTDDWDTIKNVSHKMLPLMKMISTGALVDLLQDYANGNQSKDNKDLLLELIWKSICEANQYL